MRKHLLGLAALALLTVACATTTVNPPVVGPVQPPVVAPPPLAQA